MNADGIIGANSGILGYNMFAYCNNNPVMYSDYTGHAMRPMQVYFNDGGFGFSSNTYWEPAADVVLDVTDEVNEPLFEAFANAREKLEATRKPLLYVRTYEYICLLSEFYVLVNHGGPWDIKLQEPWENMIDAPYPGQHNYVLYNGMFMTPEDLGNYTYGYLGVAYGLPLEMLYAGSYYAAGFPAVKSIAGQHELYEDRPMIKLGYEQAMNDH